MAALDKRGDVLQMEIEVGAFIRATAREEARPPGPVFGRFVLREDLVDYVAVDVGEASLDSIVQDCEFFVVDAQLVQDGRVQVVAVGRVFDGLVAEFVALSVGRAPLESAACDP